MLPFYVIEAQRTLQRWLLKSCKPFHWNIVNGVDEYNSLAILPTIIYVLLTPRVFMEKHHQLPSQTKDVFIVDAVRLLYIIN